MDFYQIKTRAKKGGIIEVYPDFKVCRSNDLMVRAKSFYAVWDDARKLWSTDEYDVQRLVDADLYNFRDSLEKDTNDKIVVKSMHDFSSGVWTEFKRYLTQVSDSSHQLDNNLTFLNSKVNKKDYVSKRVEYELKGGTINAYDEIIATLYDVDERAKLEWAIGSIIAGDAKTIQKFIVLYGPAGTGKSTIIEIIQKLFRGYYTAFEAKALTSSSNAFSTEAFKTNPLVAIQHDGDLSRIEDNTKLNSIVSHEEMTMNEKYKPSYMARVNCFLFMATNKPVKITDAKSGIIRRLIDVKPTGNLLKPKHYQALMAQIDFELGAIAKHCLDTYHKMGKNYYSSYRPLDMIFQTDVFFNFVEDNYYVFKDQDGISLKQAYSMYKEYCDETLVNYKLARHKFREELKEYFKDFSEVTRIEGKQVRSYYAGFLKNKFNVKEIENKEEHESALVFEMTDSLLDKFLKNKKAQYAKDNGSPTDYWSKVKTKLSDIDTKELHWVKPDKDHIVIDFDLTDDKGDKSFEKNLEAASKWPPTYAEISKSGKGIHLHYLYDGDVDRLSRVYDEHIEIKVFIGKSSLRRKLTKCNNIEISTINSGLPLKGEKMINFEAVKNEKNLRALIMRNLKKEIHPGTKPSVDFIYKILEDAYNSDLKYDVTDMRPNILVFANNSTNQASTCIKLVENMKFKSEEASQDKTDYMDDTLIYFDVEVFPNLFVVVWKAEGKDCVKMINPTPADIEMLIKHKLVGFNCRRYDNHILYARYIGYNNEQLYNLSQKIINNSKNAMFAEAYGLSYTDIYDFSSKKQSLKKFEIELGIHHQELGLPWDEPVPKEKWVEVAEYCVNDVVATEATFKARKQDFVARQILSELSGLSVNDTTQKHAAKILFGDDKKPQSKFEYVDLSKDFPGYVFENGKSTYRGEETGEGGYVYSEPGMYSNVALLDIASMHPNSLINMNHFGPYTKMVKELLDARIAIKHKKFNEARKALDGILEKYLIDVENNKEQAKSLSYALKIVINIIYGLTSAKFDNPFKDPRNIDNIVAKRGALFMIDLKHAVQDLGYQVAHIKTDSIKIPNADYRVIDFVTEFGKKWGYDFEHEATYDKMCLVNDAVYIAKYKMKDGEPCSEWTATGAQFAHPYVFKTLFSKEDIEFKDLCETKTVTTALYLDMNEGLDIEEHDYHFVGKAGSFCPIKAECGGGMLMRKKDDKYYAATGSKGFRWLEAEMVQELMKENDIDEEYHRKLCDAAYENISKFGDFEWFVSDSIDDAIDKNPDIPPLNLPCGEDLHLDCERCPNYICEEDRETCKLGYEPITLPF